MARGKATQEKEKKEKGKKGKAKPSKAKKGKASEEIVEPEEVVEPPAAGLETETPAEKAKEVVEEKVEELKEREEEEAPEEEAKPAEAEEKEEEEELEIVEEKFYNLNLRKIWMSPREKRTPRAVRFLRDFIQRRMKTDEVSLSEETNHMLWARGISKPPRKIRVRAVKDKEGRVIVFPGEGK